MQEHIIYVKNKVSLAIGKIYKAKKYANKQTVRQMYYTFVFPYLIYCCEICGNTSQIHLDSIIKYQKKIIRIMIFSLLNYFFIVRTVTNFGFKETNYP